MEMLGIELNQLRTLNIDGVIRIRDYSCFFDSNQRRLKALLEVTSNCTVKILHIGLEPDVIITLSPQDSDWLSSVGEKHSYSHFYVEMERIRTLLITLVLLIDPKAVVNIDFPELEELVGRSVYDYSDFIRETNRTDCEIEQSGVIPKQLDEKIDSLINLIFPPQDYILGTCHRIWKVKQNILRYGFNLDWKTPSQMFPDILFD